MGTASEPRVGAFADELPTRTFAAIQRVCRELGTELVALDPNKEAPHGVDVLVGCLGPGERRIRRHYLDRAADSETLSLLLLAEDQLARPTVALEQGRVTLIEQSSSELIRARLRMLLSGEASPTERLTPRFWAADTRAWSKAESARTSTLRLDFDHPAPAALELLEHDWRLLWPQKPRSLWLISPLRLPRASDLSRLYGGGPQHSLPAQSGDVMLALAEAQGDWPPDVVRELSRRCDLGGPNVFDWASARFGRNGSRVAVVEVR